MYLSWDEKTITKFDDKTVESMYERGYVFTRLGKGAVARTRSVRIDLEKFELSSENRRILKKTESIDLKVVKLPHPDYDWRIHKLGFDFYTAKFGKGTFSANKIKELLTSEQSNFNRLFQYVIPSEPRGDEGTLSKRPIGQRFPACRQAGSPPVSGIRNDRNETVVGYCICAETDKWLHYAYPFYDLGANITNLGIGMMTRAIVWAKEQGKKYICLGSAQNPSAVYKLQFAGLEWFNKKEWKNDLTELKKLLICLNPQQKSV